MPGATWSAAELEHHAGMLALAFIAQNSCNCLSPKLLLLDRDWPQHDAFVTALQLVLHNLKLLPPHYPGIEQRYEGFRRAYPEREEIRTQLAPTAAGTAPVVLPWMLLHLEDGSSTYALQNEAFSPVLAIWSLRCGNDAAAFLDRAVPFCNERVWGTLSCNLIVHDQLLGAEATARAIDAATAALRYGCVSVNTWTGSCYGLSTSTWGAYPGEPLDNVASGRGIVGNALLINDVRKSVVRAPFIHQEQLSFDAKGRSKLAPVHFRAITDITVKPSLGNLCRLIFSMMAPTVAAAVQS